MSSSIVGVDIPYKCEDSGFVGLISKGTLKGVGAKGAPL
jgi:hypothetical protein